MLYNAENPHGGDLYGQPAELDFSVNLNPLGTPPAVREAIALSAEHIDRYPDPFCRELREALAKYEGVLKEYILCGNGAAELIYSCCAALRPNEALVPVPTFSEYETALRAAGCEVRHFSLCPEDDFALPEAFLNELERTDAGLVVLCNPNNPTGRLIDPVLLRRIAEVCQRRGIRLFVDECFLELTDEGNGRSLKNLLEQYPNLFLLKAFTKSFSMAGARLGYCLSADRELLSAMSRTVQPWNVSLPAQAAGLAALGETAFLERARTMLTEQRAILSAGLAALGFRVIPSDANFILFHSGKPLKQPLLDRGSLIRDCANFPDLGAGWYRIAIKLPGENARLLSSLGEIVNG